MIINSEYFIYVNIAIGVIYALYIVMGYIKGLVRSLISLCSMIVSLLLAYFFCRPLALKYPFINAEKLMGIIDINPVLNQVVYFLIVFVGAMFIFKIVSLLLKIVDKVPVVGTFNKIGGALLGGILATILIVILSLFISEPLIMNATEVKENTMLKYVPEINGFIKEEIIEKIGVKDIINLEDVDIQQFVDKLVNEDITIENFEEIKEKIGLDKINIEEFIKEHNINISADSLNKLIEKFK